MTPLSARMLAGFGALVVGLAGPVSVAAAQEPPVPPSVDPAATTTSTTISTTTTTVCLEPQPQFPFVGTVRGRTGDRIDFNVQQAPEGSPLPPQATVLFPDQGRYLDDGAQYLVIAFGPQAELEEAGAGAGATTPTAAPAAPVDPAAPLDPAATTLPAPAPPGPLPALFGRVKLADGECGALTKHPDGTVVDTAVLKPLFDNWTRLAWAVILPALAVLAVLTVIVVLKRLATRAVLGPIGPADRPRFLPWLRPRPRARP